MTIQISQNDIILELFVRAADEDYVTARWCNMNEFDLTFLWLGVHSLEKYLKAALLMNGQHARKHNHDIIKLYKKLTGLASNLLPDRLSQPETLEIDNWLVRTPLEFLRHLLANGNADNRYGIYGYTTRGQDLHMLDQMVFCVRGLICPLSARLYSGTEPEAPTVTHREILEHTPTYYRSWFMPLDDLVAVQSDSPRRRAALNLNMAFAPSGYPHEPMSSRSASRSPVIVRRIFEPLESDNPRRAREAVEIADWFLKNVQVGRSSGVEEALKQAIEAAKARHGFWRLVNA